jgi:hypothetical protein
MTSEKLCKDCSEQFENSEEIQFEVNCEIKIYFKTCSKILQNYPIKSYITADRPSLPFNKQ